MGNKLSISHRVGVSGYFEISKKVPSGQIFPITEFPNMILDSGLNMLGGSSTFLNAIQVGTGNTAPNPSQTSLVNRVAGVAASFALYSTGGAPTYYREAVYTATFPVGSVVGVISEIGAGPSATGTLFSRALIANTSGVPMTITLLADEQLVVTYRLRNYPPLEDLTGEVVFTGNIGGTYEFISRAHRVNAWEPQGRLSISGSQAVYTGDIGAITDSSISGAAANAASVPNPYVNGSFTATGFFTCSAAQGNLTGGIRSLRVEVGNGGIRDFKIQFNPPIPKTNNDALSIALSVSWGRS